MFDAEQDRRGANEKGMNHGTGDGFLESESELAGQQGNQRDRGRGGDQQALSQLGPLHARVIEWNT